MTYKELVARYREQFDKAINEYVALGETDPACCFAAGMLQLVSALTLKGKETPITQLRALHQAIHDIGAARGWGIDKKR